MELRDKHVVVTGASSGIGAATARALAAEGAVVALVARSGDALEEVAREIRDRGGRARPFVCDVADLSAVAAVCATILDDLGGVDVLVNNAGIGRWLAIDETDPHEALAMTMVPYVGAFAMTHHLVKPMIARRSGLVVNVTSPAAFMAFPGSAAYSVARGAMRHFTKALNSDLRGTGVRAVLVTPGEVESGYWEHNPGARQRVPGISILFRTLTTDQAAGAVVRAARRERDVTSPALLAAVIGLHAVLPWPVEALVTTTGWKRSRAEQSTPAPDGSPVR
ncbi:MAG: SDR family oxidoreductase [Candidatus Nanopelagicales bacterium]